MVWARIQIENLSKEELIDELISVVDISSRLSDLISRFDDFLRWYEIFSSDLTVSKNCNRLQNERIIQLGRNAVNNAEYHRRESLEINPVPIQLTYVPALPFWTGDSRFEKTASILQFLPEISRFAVILA